jgi:very-short-patch-repair endonuclease
VPRNDAKKIIESSNNSKNRKLIELDGVDHTFTLRYGKEDPAVLNNEVFNIIKDQVQGV